LVGTVAVVTLFLAAPTCGPLDLPSAQALAVARSDEVGIKRSELAAAEADRAVATAIHFLPEFNLTVPFGIVPGARLADTPNDPLNPSGPHGKNNSNVIDYASGTNRGLTELGPFFRVEVNALQPLWTWGRLKSASDAAKAGVAARSELVQDTSNAIRQRVLQLMLTIRLSTRLLGIAADVENALKDVDVRVQKSLKANDGEISPEDRYRIELFRSQLIQRKADGERALRLARVGLAATLALEPDKLQLRDEALPDTRNVHSPDLAQVRLEAEQYRPDLKALDNVIRAKEAEVHGTRAELLPQLGLVGQFAWSRAPGRDTITNPYVGDYFNALSINVALAIKQNLSFWIVITRANKIDAELKTLRRQREGALRGIQVEVETAVADLNAAIAKREAAAKAVASGRSWFRSATLNFGVGVADARDLIDAYRGYVEAQLGDALATYDLLVAEGRLHQVTGRMPPDPVLDCAMP
jgi:outer membrane protein TolC